MRPMKRTACLVGLIALVFTATASADSLDDQLAQLRPVAEQWWAAQGVTATRCATVEFTHAPMPTGTWAGTLEGADLVNPLHPGEPIDICHVAFSDALALDAPRRCAAVLHEWGHILGLDHTDDRTNIMYGSGLVVPPVCGPPRKGQGPSLTRSRTRASVRRMRAVMARL